MKSIFRKTTETSIMLLFLLSFVFTSCNSQKQNTNDTWAEINDTLKSRWDNYIGQHELLPKPYTKALGAQKEFYYWDVYFINKGLLVHERFDLIKNNIDNLTFEIDSFGYVPNALVSWGISRSQPPFYSMMVRDYYEAVSSVDKGWLLKCYNAALQEYAFWNNASTKVNGNNATTIEGLSRYGYMADTASLASVYKGISHRFPELPEMTENEKIKFGADIIAECGTGMDFTWRYQQRCTDFVSVDLNSNLYVYEKNFSWFENILGLSPSQNWDSLAQIRKERINKYCWDEERGLFTDYDFVNTRLNPVASMAMFWPLYFGVATQEQAARSVNALDFMQSEWGIRATELVEAPYKLQWDGNAVWAPVQLMAYGALKKYGFDIQANKVAETYLNLVSKNWQNPYPKSFEHDGETLQRKPCYIWEKYSVDGNINDADYPSNEMMGWSAGVFVYFFNELNSEK
ncbi:MAG: trehalase family glycosidase [Prolixibacteraceae bacterium]